MISSLLAAAGSPSKVASMSVSSTCWMRGSSATMDWVIRDACDDSSSGSASAIWVVSAVSMRSSSSAA